MKIFIILAVFFTSLGFFLAALFINRDNYLAAFYLLLLSYILNDE